MSSAAPVCRTIDILTFRGDRSRAFKAMNPLPSKVAQDAEYLGVLAMKFRSTRREMRNGETSLRSIPIQ